MVNLQCSSLYNFVLKAERERYVQKEVKNTSRVQGKLKNKCPDLKTAAKNNGHDTPKAFNPHSIQG